MGSTKWNEMFDLSYYMGNNEYSDLICDQNLGPKPFKFRTYTIFREHSSNAHHMCNVKKATSSSEFGRGIQFFFEKDSCEITDINKFITSYNNCLKISKALKPIYDNLNWQTRSAWSVYTL